MKKINLLKRIALGATVLGLGTALLSCSSFSKGGALKDGLFIDDVTTERMADGSTLVTITYTSDDKAPTTFIIPAGNEGNGITGVETKTNEDGTTTITISYREGEDTVLTVDKAVGIASVESTYDEETGDTSLIITYSDGTKSDPIVIAKGQKGDTGNGIASISVVPMDDGSSLLIIKFTDEDMANVTVTIPAPLKGDTGVGIEDIVCQLNEEDGFYHFYITYTDGNTADRAFAQFTSWHSGAGLPSNDIGIEGDFYFDTAHQVIYHKENGVWVPTVDLKTQGQAYTLTFNLNDENDASMPAGYTSTYQITDGEYFYSSTGKNLPVPTRSGYEFHGWWTSSFGDKDPNAGHLTELTSICSDLTVYASWEAAS